MTSSPRIPAVTPAQLMSRVFAFLAAALLVLISAGMLRGFLPPAVGRLVWGLVSACALGLVIQWFLVREHRVWREVGLGMERGSVPRFGGGLFLGIATYAGTLGASAVLLGPIGLATGPSISAGSVFLILAGIFALAAMEELAFRSYALWTAAEALGRGPAQLFTAVAFALLHVAYGWSLTTVAFGVLPSALLFGVAALASGGLALPLGIHAGINLGRWLTGETDGTGPLRLDLTGLDANAAATWAPWIGAAVPLLVAVALWAAYRRNGTMSTRADR